MLVTSRVIEREDSSLLELGSIVGLPSSILSTEEAGTEGSIAVKCTELVASTLVDCSVLIGGIAQFNYTRLATVNLNLVHYYNQNHFWLRTDVSDQAEFAVLNNLRVSIRSVSSGQGSSRVWVKWMRLHSAQSSDSQNDSSGVRTKATLSSGSDKIELEMRSALSQVVVQKGRKVVVDVIPGGGSASGLDLWSAQPSSPSQLIDSVHVLVRPRDGRNF